MSKQVTLGGTARENLVKGIDVLANAVVSTLGPNGRNVVIANDQGSPQSTKDGVTVAKSISLSDPINIVFRSFEILVPSSMLVSSTHLKRISFTFCLFIII